jgi:type I restriction enzyme S subunit
MTAFTLTTLGAICKESGGEIQTGPFGSQLHASDYVDFGIPSIMPQNIGDNRISTNGISRISKQDALRLSRYLVKQGDIVYSRRGDVERRALVREHENGWLCGTGCLRIRFGNHSKICPEFISFYLGTPIAREWIVQNAVGATMPNLNTSILSDAPIWLPSFETQESIASVLGSFDDKIELNRRMNETLEAMAQAIFRDWFVDFGPVRRKASGLQDPVAILGGMIDDAARAATLAALFPDRIEEDGLPVGWFEEPLKDQADWINGAAYKKIHFVPPNEGLPVVKIGELKSGISASTGFTNSDLGSRYKINNGELLFSWSGNPDTSIDTFIWSGGPAWLNQHIFAVRPNGKKEIRFLFSMLKFLNPTFAEIARDKQTTGLGHITKEDLKRLQIVISTKDIEVEFDRFVSSIFELILNNLLEIGTLSETRDYLLPKLMSGEIRVSDAEALMKEAAE